MKFLSASLLLLCLVAGTAAQNNNAGGILPSASPAAMSVTVNGVTILISPDGVVVVQPLDGFAPPPPPDATLTYLTRVGVLTLNWWKGPNESGDKFRDRVTKDIAAWKKVLPEVTPPTPPPGTGP